MVRLFGLETLVKTVTVRDRYYDGNGKKTDFSVFAKASYLLNEKLEFYGDLQLRKLNYKTSGITSDLVNMLIDQSYSFLIQNLVYH